MRWRSVVAVQRWPLWGQLALVAVLSVAVGALGYTLLRSDGKSPKEKAFEKLVQPGILEIANETSERLILHEFPFGDGPGTPPGGLFVIKSHTTARVRCSTFFTDHSIGDSKGRVLSDVFVECPTGGREKRLVITKSDLKHRTEVNPPAPTKATPDNQLPEA